MGTKSYLGILTISSSYLTSMKVMVILSCLVILAIGSPNPQRLRKRIRNQVENKKCGEGVDATCVCPDGTQPGRGRFPCNGAGNPTCSCDDGSASTVVTRKKVRDQIRDFFQGDQDSI